MGAIRLVALGPSCICKVIIPNCIIIIRVSLEFSSHIGGCTERVIKRLLVKIHYGFTLGLHQLILAATTFKINFKTPVSLQAIKVSVEINIKKIQKCSFSKQQTLMFCSSPINPKF